MQVVLRSLILSTKRRSHLWYPLVLGPKIYKAMQAVEVILLCQKWIRSHTGNGHIKRKRRTPKGIWWVAR